MEQRSLRLGDIVDDYCPRERRITNHAIVAIVGDAIRQTRCSTCDAEHEYKEGRVPKKKVKSGEAGSDLAGGVLVTHKAPPAANGEATDVEVVMEAAPETNGEAAETTPETGVSKGDSDASAEEPQNDEPLHDGWMAHRRLIRATLPKTENGEAPARPIPEFTMHQRPGRGFGGRGFRHGQPGNFNGGPPREGNGPDGNRAPGPHGGGKGGRRRRRRRPR